MKAFLLFCAFSLAGCIPTNYEAIVANSPSVWTKSDCVEVIRTAMVHNVYDQNANIRIFATPYFPVVVTALNRLQQLNANMTDDESKISLNKFARETMGVYYDWYEDKFLDPRGKYLKDRTQIDSLLFVVTVENKTFPCTIPYSFALKRPIMDLLALPCYSPVLDDIDNRIFLENDKHEILQPRYIYGRKGSQLLKDETLLVMFPLRSGGTSFLEGSNMIYVIIRGFGDDIKLPFSLAMMQ